MTAVAYPHIEVNPQGVAFVAGTTTKVVEIVLDHLAHHWDAFEIRRQYPYLSLAQIHASLTYYYDHEEEMNRDIEERCRRVAEIQRRRGDSAVKDKLKNAGHLP